MKQSLKSALKHKFIKKISLPANIARINCLIEVEIRNEKISLLLNKNYLKTARTVLDIGNHKVKTFDKDVDFYFSTSMKQLIPAIFPVK